MFYEKCKSDEFRKKKKNKFEDISKYGFDFGFYDFFVVDREGLFEIKCIDFWINLIIQELELNFCSDLEFPIHRHEGGISSNN